MSNALAIASVTRVMKDLLNNGLVDHDISGALGGNVTVSALPPDRVLGPQGAPETSQINLFLHQVTPNPGWRNADLPTLGPRGERISDSLLALDLHYLLTAYGAEELHAEILLGYAMQLLHETPVLSRAALRAALASPAVNGSILPPAFAALSASDLADQFELIKIIPQTLSAEDMSRLWTAFQSHYRPTAGYQVSVVLIQRRRPKRASLPVLTRGQPDPLTGRDQGIAVQASLLPPFPTIETLTPNNQQIAARMGEVVTLTGHHLDGDLVTVRFTEPRTRMALILPAMAGASAARVQVQLPPDPPPAPVPAASPLNPENWRAGAYNVAVVVERAGEPDHASNELPMALAPRILSITPTVAATIVTFAVTCSPKVRKGQEISLIVGARQIPAEPFGTAQTDTLSFQTSALPSGSAHWSRLRVDGFDSLLIDRAARPPAFFASEQVTIP